MTAKQRRFPDRPKGIEAVSNHPKTAQMNNLTGFRIGKIGIVFKRLGLNLQ